jgi:hypothetical protein
MTTISDCKPGQRVRIKYTIDRRDGDWHGEVEGVIEQIDLEKTGSWYAHSKDNKFWLRRVKLRKDDGELSLLNLDYMTDVDIVDG